MWLLAVVLVLLSVYLVIVYNSLVEVRHAVSQAWANIDVLLKQRHDELPKLIDTCKQYMQHEQETLERVIAARAGVARASDSGNITALGNAETALRQGLGQLFAVAEQYPELRSSEKFLHLQSRISGLENSIADRREYYNDSVALYNTRIDQFPGLLVAKTLGYETKTSLQFARAELQDVDVAARFKG